jgi:hypothetical protein
VAGIEPKRVAVMQPKSPAAIEPNWVAAISRNAHLTTATGRLLVHLLGAFAEFEASVCKDIVAENAQKMRITSSKLHFTVVLFSPRI